MSITLANRLASDISHSINEIFQEDSRAHASQCHSRSFSKADFVFAYATAEGNI